MAYKQEIVSGPSKMDLMLAVFDGARTKRRSVEFEVTTEGGITWPMTIIVDRAGRIDGSDENWTFKGVRIDHAFDSRPVSGHFSTKTRKGTIYSK